MKKLEGGGCQLLHHGSKHDIYHNPSTGKCQQVPRHNENNDVLAKKIPEDLFLLLKEAQGNSPVLLKSAALHRRMPIAAKKMQGKGVATGCCIYSKNKFCP